MWAAGGGGDGSPGLHPFLRRLLLHLLGLRSQCDDNWASVHGRLQDYYKDRGDSVGSCYHALANSDLGTAVRLLRHEFENQNPAWVLMLREITSAPRITPPAGPPARDVVRQLVRSVSLEEDDRGLATLVASLWVSADPLGDPTGSLNARIAAAFERLAHRAGSLEDDMLDEAERHRRHGENR
jgi:hypothetical protein